MTESCDSHLFPIFRSPIIPEDALVTKVVTATTFLASLLTLLAAVASTSKLKGVLLPIIALPVLFPVFLCGLEMTTEVLLNGQLGEGSSWPVILLCAHTFYVVAGVNLFELAVRE